MHRSNRTIIEDLPYIDVFELSRLGAFSGGEQNFPYIGLKYTFLSRLRAQRYRLDVRMRNSEKWLYFRVEWTRCNYGGSRPWLVCSCGKRAARLYCGGIFIGCRHCYKARYQSQRLGSEKARDFRQACKIRMSLGGEPSIRGPFPERPYRMWRKTYDRLRREAEGLEGSLQGSRFAKRPPDYESFSFF
jgi:hypothetical protein